MSDAERQAAWERWRDEHPDLCSSWETCRCHDDRDTMFSRAYDAGRASLAPLLEQCKRIIADEWEGVDGLFGAVRTGTVWRALAGWGEASLDKERGCRRSDPLGKFGRHFA